MSQASGRDLVPVLLDQAKWHDVVVEYGVDLDVAAQRVHVVSEGAQVEVLAALDAGDVRLGHAQHPRELRLGLADVLAKFGKADRRDDRALAGVDLSGGAGALPDLFA